MTSIRRGGRRNLPLALTEHGVAMLSSVLRNRRAMLASVQIVRTSVQVRAMLRSQHVRASKLDALEQRYDARFRIVFDAIRRLMRPRSWDRRRIGFEPPRRV